MYKLIIIASILAVVNAAPTQYLTPYVAAAPLTHVATQYVHTAPLVAAPLVKTYAAPVVHTPVVHALPAAVSHVSQVSYTGHVLASPQVVYKPSLYHAPTVFLH